MNELARSKPASADVPACVDTRLHDGDDPLGPLEKTHWGRNELNWTFASLTAQVTLLAYYQVHEWVHLPPWNDTSPSPGNSQARLDIVMGVIQLGLIAGVSAEFPAAMAIGVFVYAGWLVLQVVGWWIPYLRGASEGHMRFYEKHWAGTWRFLPPIGDHPVPNAAHVVLQALVIASLGSTAAALVRAAV